MGASAGQFLQRDPAGYVDGLGLYEYVQSSPASASDPSGLSRQARLAFAAWQEAERKLTESNALKQKTERAAREAEAAYAAALQKAAELYLALLFAQWNWRHRWPFSSCGRGRSIDDLRQQLEDALEDLANAEDARIDAWWADALAGLAVGLAQLVADRAEDQVRGTWNRVLPAASPGTQVYIGGGDYMVVRGDVASLLDDFLYTGTWTAPGDGPWGSPDFKVDSLGHYYAFAWYRNVGVIWGITEAGQVPRFAPWYSGGKYRYGEGFWRNFIPPMRENERPLGTLVAPWVATGWGSPRSQPLPDGLRPARR